MFSTVCVCSSGVFADSDAVKSVSVMEGDSVSLQTNTELRTDDEIMWTFGLSGTRIAEIIKDTGRFSTFEGPDGRFRDRLKLDHQTGSLTITNTRTTDSGLYQKFIIRNRTVITYRFNVTVSGESHLLCPLCCQFSLKKYLKSFHEPTYLISLHTMYFV